MTTQPNPNSPAYDAPDTTARALLRDASLDLHRHTQAHGIDWQYADERLNELSDALDGIAAYAAADEVMWLRLEVEDRRLDPEIAGYKLDALAGVFS